MEAVVWEISGSQDVQGWWGMWRKVSRRMIGFLAWPAKGWGFEQDCGGVQTNSQWQGGVGLVPTGSRCSKNLKKVLWVYDTACIQPLSGSAQCHLQQGEYILLHTAALNQLSGYLKSHLCQLQELRKSLLGWSAEKGTLLWRPGQHLLRVKSPLNQDRA